jgi:hypothetical protein
MSFETKTMAPPAGGLCPRCSTALTKSPVFCPHCGYRLKQTISGTEEASSFQKPSGFVDWYCEKFSSITKLPTVGSWFVQYLLWFGAGGWIWIPIWYLNTRSSKQASPAETSDRMADGTESIPAAGQASQQFDPQTIWRSFISILTLIGTAIRRLVKAIPVRVCPNCKQSWAATPGSQVCTGRREHGGTITRYDEHVNSQGQRVGSTRRQEQVRMVTSDILQNWRCKKCDHTWSTTFQRTSEC